MRRSATSDFRAATNNRLQRPVLGTGAESERWAAQEYDVTSRPEQLIDLAQSVADERHAFFDIKGAGAGDRDTNEFMATLRDRARTAFGDDFAEQRICGDNGLCVDFYFREEETIVEIALGLRNPLSEFERDILKAIMSKEARYPVRRLLFVSKPGATKRCSQPGARAIVDWAKRAHGIRVDVQELRVSRAV